jgi:hypothetical protein
VFFLDEKKLRNQLQIFGHWVVFKRAGFLNHKNKLFNFFHLVFIDDSFIGVVQSVCGHGIQLVCLSDDSVPLVFKNVSRVKCVQDFLIYRSKSQFGILPPPSGEDK